MADSESRLWALSRYLGLDWDWFTSRCRTLGEYGVAGLVQPRSRLLTVSAPDETLLFHGRLPPGLQDSSMLTPKLGKPSVSTAAGDQHRSVLVLALGDTIAMTPTAST
jgi:hypothetical protein